MVWVNDTPKALVNPFVVLASSYLAENMSKRSREMPNEQVPAKSMPLRGLFFQKKNAPEAMKEHGRNEYYPSNTAWWNPRQPHPSPKTVAQEDCYEDYPGNTVWRNPMPSTDSQPKENKSQSSSSSSWRHRVREGAASSTHSTARSGVRSTPAPKPPRDPLISNLPVMKVKT